MKKLFAFRGYAALAAVLAILIGVFMPICTLECHLSDSSVEHLKFLAEESALANSEKEAGFMQWIEEIEKSIELSDKYTDDDRDRMAEEILKIEEGRSEKKAPLKAAVTEYYQSVKRTNELNAESNHRELTESEDIERGLLYKRIEELDEFMKEEIKSAHMTEQNQIAELAKKIGEKKGYKVKISIFGAVMNVGGIIKSCSVIRQLNYRDGLISEIEKMKSRGDSTSKIESEEEKLKETELWLYSLSEEGYLKGVNADALDYALMFQHIGEEMSDGLYSDTANYPTAWSVMYDLAFEATEERTYSVAIVRFILMLTGIIVQLVAMIFALVVGIISLVKLKDLGEIEKFSTDEIVNVRRMTTPFMLAVISAVLMGGSVGVGLIVAGIVVAVAAVYNIVTFILGGYFGKFSRGEKIHFIISKARCLVIAAFGIAIVYAHMAADKNMYINNLLFFALKKFDIDPYDLGMIASLWPLFAFFYAIVGLAATNGMIMSFGGIGDKKGLRRKESSALSYGIVALIFALVPFAMHFIEPVLYSYRMTEMILMVVLFVVALGFKIAESRFGLEKERIIQLAEYSVYPEKKFVGFNDGSSQLG